MSKILVFGKNGQVGWELQRSLGLVGDVVYLGREDRGGNLLDIHSVVDRIREEKPEIVFNAAAYTAVDAAENDRDTAKLINCDAVAAMADVCGELNTLLVHYSTDYVFNGFGDRPWNEDDLTNPINAYGSSKALGEKAIKESGCRAYIFRTSWVYGIHGKNFVKTMLRLARYQKNITVVNDQIGTPTSAAFVADVSTYLALYRQISRVEVFNLVPNGIVSWYEFASFIFSDLKKNQISPILTAIKSADYHTVALRPLNSRLDNSKLTNVLPVGAIKKWDFYAQRVLEVLLNSKE